MLDMLVKLYELPDMKPLVEQLAAEGIGIRRALAAEKHYVTAFIAEHFGSYWVSETEVSYSRQPLACFIATHENKVIGFADYDAVARGFFGPTGVNEAYRGKGIGKALLLACLWDMWSQGYGYCIIGDAGPMDFYTKAVGAVAIPGSKPGVYKGMIKDWED